MWDEREASEVPNKDTREMEGGGGDEGRKGLSIEGQRSVMFAHRDNSALS